MNTPRTDAAMSDTEEITEIEATCSPSAKRIEQLETELTAVTAKLEKCRAALGGISEYGKMCKGTDAARMKYLADKAIDQTE